MDFVSLPHSIKSGLGNLLVFFQVAVKSIHDTVRQGNIGHQDCVTLQVLRRLEENLGGGNNHVRPVFLEIEGDNALFYAQGL